MAERNQEQARHDVENGIRSGTQDYSRTGRVEGPSSGATTSRSLDTVGGYYQLAQERSRRDREERSNLGVSNVGGSYAGADQYQGRISETSPDRDLGERWSQSYGPGYGYGYGEAGMQGYGYGGRDLSFEERERFRHEGRPWYRPEGREEWRGREDWRREELRGEEGRERGFFRREEERPGLRGWWARNRGFEGLGRDRWAQDRTEWEREPLCARDIMTTNVKSVRRDASVREVARIMRDEKVGAVPVVDENLRLLGLVTDRDIVMRTVDHDRHFGDLRVETVMTEDLDVCTPDERVTDIIDLMGRSKVRRIPVVDRRDRLVGVVSISDIAKRAEFDSELRWALERLGKRRSFWHRLFD